MNHLSKTVVYFVLLSIFNLTTVHGSVQVAPEKSWLDLISPINDLQLVITPEQDYTELFKAFKSAQKNIKVGIFGISSKEIAASLIEQSHNLQKSCFGKS